MNNTNLPEKEQAIVKVIQHPEMLKQKSVAEREKIEAGAEREGAKETEIKAREEQTPVATAPIAPPASARPAKPEELIKVEKIMEAGLNELYKKMPLDKQRQFRIEGEKTANIIWQMVKTAKIQVKKILELIIHWLKIIPGVNKFFLEQEAKIKTDQIIALAKKNQKQ